MRLSVSGLRSLNGVELEIGNALTLVIGSNGAGKSTLALAAAALLARDGRLGRTREDRVRGLLTDGSDAATALLVGDAGAVRIVWPEGEVKQRGTAPISGRIACGLDRPARVDVKTRSAMLIQALKADPTARDWSTACTEAGLGEAVATMMWLTISRDGWEAGAKDAADQARDCKAVWRKLAQASSYPSKGAEVWQPPGYEMDDLMLEKPQHAAAAVVAEQARRDAVLRANAVGAAERERLTALADRTTVIAGQRQMADTENAIAGFEREVADWAGKLAHVEVGRALCPCPHCQLPVEIWPAEDRGGPPLRKPRNAAAVDPVTMAEWRASMADAKSRLQQAQTALGCWEDRHRRAKEAGLTLAGLPPLDEMALDKAEVALTQAKDREAAVRATHEARELFERIQGLTLAAQLAGPTGLRQKKLAETLALVNAGLNELCATAGWGQVAIGKELEINYAGRPFADISESEGWRTDAAIAIEVARRDQSALVVLDRADVLDGRGRNGLLELAARAGMPILAMMTAPKSQAEAIAATGAAVWLLAGGSLKRCQPGQDRAAA